MEQADKKRLHGEALSDLLQWWSVRVGKAEHNKNAVFKQTETVADFLREYDTIIVHRMFNPQDWKFSHIAVFNFVQEFLEPHPRYNTLLSNNGQKFVEDFSRTFFNIQSLSKRKALRRLSAVVGIVFSIGAFVL